MAQLDVGVLVGRRVILEPLRPDHAAGLTVAADEERATFGFTQVPEGPRAMAAYVAGLIDGRERGETIPFAQVRAADGIPVGVTRFLTIRTRPGNPAPFAVEVGGTWLARSAQRSGINPEAKLLLFTHAFESWRVGRLDIKTDARNERARQAILALGARLEGVLRGWQPSQVTGEEGRLRDTAMYSIVAAEWPEVRDRLRTRLARR